MPSDPPTRRLVARVEQPHRATIVCLCGSTRFYDAFQRANYEETMAGKIVLSVGFYPHSAGQAHGEGVGHTEEEKRALDELHLRKIDLADEVLILNVGGYIGESTARELAYARERGKQVRFLETQTRPYPSGGRIRLRAERDCYITAMVQWLVEIGYPYDMSIRPVPEFLREPLVEAWWKTDGDGGTSLEDYRVQLAEEGGWE